MLKGRGFDGEGFAFFPVHKKNSPFAYQPPRKKDGGVGGEAAIPEPNLGDGPILPIDDDVPIAFD
jgi:hypothetical protein